jgi:glycosyltransferase involved in cell wall biosynthesis
LSKVTIVTPVFNEEESVSIFAHSIEKIFSNLKFDYEIIFCLDPSTDGTEEAIKEICSSNNRVKLLSFNRRIGQDLAVLAGIEHAMGDATIIMDCDLQDPPSAIPEMIDKWQKGARIVIGKRISRESDNFLKKFFSKLFHKFLNKFSDVAFPVDVGDFRLLDKGIAKYVNEFKEAKPFTKGVMSWIGGEYEFVQFNRPERVKGETKYNINLGGYKIAIKSIISYSNVLLRFSLFFGIVVSLTSFIFGISYGILSIFTPGLPIGLPTIVVLLSFLSGAILLSIGILGMYVDRIFDEVKNRPRYTVKEFING